MGHAAPSSSSSSAAPFARSLPRPGCIGVCVEGGGVLSLWLLSSGCFLIYFFDFPLLAGEVSLLGGGKRPVPSPEVSCPRLPLAGPTPAAAAAAREAGTVPPPLQLLKAIVSIACSSLLLSRCLLACSSFSNAAKICRREGRGEGEERPSHPEWLRAPRLRRGEGRTGMGNHERQHGLVPVPNRAGGDTPRKLWLPPKNPADVSPGLAAVWDGRCGDGVAGAKPASLGWSCLTMAGPREDGFTDQKPFL